MQEFTSSIHTNRRKVIIPITANAVAISAHEVLTFMASAPPLYLKDDI
jgi:hypothetical protein